MKSKKTQGTSAFNEFMENSEDCGLFPPPLSAKKALEILRLHFAPDLITPNPVSPQQFNAELVAYILRQYKGQKR